MEVRDILISVHHRITEAQSPTHIALVTKVSILSPSAKKEF